MKIQIERKLDKFFSSYKKLNLKKGQTLIRADDPITDIFFLKHGYVRQYLISNNGEEFTLHIYRPKSFFPIALVLGKKANKYYFETISNSEIIKVPVREVLSFLRDNPDVLMDLTSRLSAGFFGFIERSEYLLFGQARSKIVSLIKYLASHFGQKNNKGIAIRLPFTHKEIAAWIGTNRETVSRQMRKFKDQGVIDYKRHLISIQKAGFDAF